MGYLAGTNASTGLRWNAHVDLICSATIRQLSVLFPSTASILYLHLAVMKAESMCRTVWFIMTGSRTPSWYLLRSWSDMQCSMTYTAWILPGILMSHISSLLVRMPPLGYGAKLIRYYHVEDNTTIELCSSQAHTSKGCHI